MVARCPVKSKSRVQRSYRTLQRNHQRLISNLHHIASGFTIKEISAENTNAPNSRSDPSMQEPSSTKNDPMSQVEHENNNQSTQHKASSGSINNNAHLSADTPTNSDNRSVFHTRPQQEHLLSQKRFSTRQKTISMQKRNSRLIQSIAVGGTNSMEFKSNNNSVYRLSSLQMSEADFASSSTFSGQEGTKITVDSATEYTHDPILTMRNIDTSKPQSSRSFNRGYLREGIGMAIGNMLDNSVLWMHRVSDINRDSGRNSSNHQHDSRASRSSYYDKQSTADSTDSLPMPMPIANNKPQDVLSTKYMFYTSQTGPVYGQTLVDPVDGASGIDMLIENVQATNPGGCFWLDISGASAQEVTELGDIFELHPLTIQDITLGSPRDKLDCFNSYMFIIYTAAVTEGNSNKGSGGCSLGGSNCNLLCCINPPGDKTTGQYDYNKGNAESKICIVIRPQYILTFHDGSQKEVVGHVLQRLLAMQKAQGGMGTADVALCGLVDFSPYIAYAILDEITDQLSPAVLAMEQQVNMIDSLVLVLPHSEYEDMLQQMGEQRQRILGTWQTTQPKIDVVQGLREQVQVQMHPMADEVSQYLGDVLGHLNAAISSCTHAETVLSRSHSNYLAKISLELARATFDSNSTTERWTMLGTIVVPINIVTSFLGVNLKVPGQDRDDTVNFFIVLACMFIYAGAMLAFWRWRRVI